MKKADYRKWKKYADEKEIPVFNQSDYEKRNL